MHSPNAQWLWKRQIHLNADPIPEESDNERARCGYPS
jgi:hypothetical protein